MLLMVVEKKQEQNRTYLSNLTFIYISTWGLNLLLKFVLTAHGFRKQEKKREKNCMLRRGFCLRRGKYRNIINEG